MDQVGNITRVMSCEVGNIKGLMSFTWLLNYLNGGGQKVRTVLLLGKRDIEVLSCGLRPLLFSEKALGRECRRKRNISQGASSEMTMPPGNPPFVSGRDPFDKPPGHYKFAVVFMTLMVLSVFAALSIADGEFCMGVACASIVAVVVMFWWRLKGRKEFGPPPASQ